MRPYPKPPLGVLRCDRRRRWFRWYVTYRIEYLIWLVRMQIKKLDKR